MKAKFESGSRWYLPFIVMQESKSGCVILWRTNFFKKQQQKRVPGSKNF